MLSISSVSLVGFEQVNVCWNIIKSLPNYCWSILKTLCIKFCPRPSNFYWHNALMYNPFLNENAGDKFTYYILENLISTETIVFPFLIMVKQSGAGNMVWRQVK